jgi:regulator of extracellular matrix RemA (YlzA/DUF370 family)
MNQTSSMLDVGFNNYIKKDEVVMIVDNRTRIAKKLRDEARKRSLNAVVDMTLGKKGWSLIRLKGGIFVISVVHRQQLVTRMDAQTSHPLPAPKRPVGRPRHDGTQPKSQAPKGQEKDTEESSD